MTFLKKGSKFKVRAISSLICISLGLVTLTNVRADEPTKFLTGDTSAESIYNNIDYLDIMNSPSWATQAIYESGALNIMKGYGSRLFSKDDPMTREQALAMALRLGGLEADAKQAAEDLDKARKPADKINEPFLYWSLGYLKIAADEGLITAQEYKDAASSNGTSGFNGKARAQRQEMAYWIAKALKFSPKYDEQAILNNFSDWRQCDAEKIAYIEATLQNRIMNGDGYGAFLPKGTLTREQAAQIAKNAENYVLPAMKLAKNSGTIEKLTPVIKVQNGKKINSIDYYVRNIDGSLSSFNSGFAANNKDLQNNELTGDYRDNSNTDLIVYKNGNLAHSGALSAGDRIEYIYDDAAKVVKFVNVISSNLDTEYLVGQIKNIDTKKLSMSINTFFKSDSPDVDLVQQYANLISQGATNRNYSYSNDAKFIVDGISVDPAVLNAEDFAIVTVVNDCITKVQKFQPKYNYGAYGVVNGTVQDNNTSLGYITLYSQDGRGVGVNPITSDLLRTFDYASIKDIQVMKDGQAASAEDIMPGDTVFLRLNSSGKVAQISAASNYTIKNATIISNKDAFLSVKYSDGTEQALTNDTSTRWFGADGSYGKDNVKDGDNVMLTLNISPTGTKLLEVRASDINSMVNNFYKVSLDNYRNATKELILSDVKLVGKNSFDRVEDRGIRTLPVTSGCKVYVDGKMVSLDDLNKIKPSSLAYIVTKSDFGNNEKAMLITVNTEQSSQLPIYNENLMRIDTTSGALVLKNSQINLPYKNETIFIKNGRVVSFNSLKENDALSIATGNYTGVNGGYAAVVVASDPVNSEYFEIYRGRINDINDNTNFKVQYFSMLEGYDFKFYNTEKSFNITPKTRMVDTAGVVSLRDFTENNYLNNSVYVISKNGDAILISTVPFTNIKNFKAEVTSVSSSTIGLKDGRLYNSNTAEWNQSNLQSVNILKNTIILKGDKVIKATDLVKGDKVKVFKAGSSSTGDAYVIVVEG